MARMRVHVAERHPANLKVPIQLPEQNMVQNSSFPSMVPSTRRIRIIVADPYPVIVHGLRKMIEDDPRFQVVSEASTLLSFRKKLIAERPEVALLDWQMASQDLETTTSLLQCHTRATSIIFLTISENSDRKREMISLGARAFVSKWCSAGRLRTAVSKVCTERARFKAEVAASDVPMRPPNSSVIGTEHRTKHLTQRERQIIPLVCSGMKNKEIALRLGISESTVWHHLTAVFTKLQVGDRLGLVAFAYGHLVFPAPEARWPFS
jgi:two-component system nitrate/nitrite response regulator NarL